MELKSIVLGAFAAASGMVIVDLVHPVKPNLSIEQKFAAFNRCMAPALPQGLQLDGTVIAQVEGSDQKLAPELMVDVVGSDVWKPAASLRISSDRSAVLDPLSAPPGLTEPQKSALSARGKKCGAEVFGF